MNRIPFLVTTLSLAMALGACSDSSETDDALPDASDDDGLAPPPEGQGVQFGMVTEIAPGTESEHCQFVVAPADADLYVNRDEVRFNAGSHHVLLYETDYESVPTEKDDGTPVDTSGVFDCSTGATDGWSVRKLVGGSQNGQGDSILAFPSNVAMRVPAGAVLLMNAHYINTTDAPLTPEVRINLHTLSQDKVEVEGDLLFIYNPLIRVPAMGQSRAHWRCPVHQDITLTNVQSHMHSLGVGYTAGLLGQQPFYENTSWEDVPVQLFDQGLSILAGSTLEYHCDYRNNGTQAVFQGPRSTDEMCMLIGSYYPADRNTALCLNEDGEQAGEWVGSGSATCAATMTCLQAAFGGQDVLRSITDCMLEADPAVSGPASNVLTCVMRTQDLQACQTEIDACQAL